MRHWLEEDIDYLKKYYGKKSTKEIAEHVGKKREAVIQYAYQHGISAHRYWTKDEENYLEENRGTLSLKYIAKKLKKSYSSVRDKNKSMRLGRFYENSEYLHLSEISRIVGRHHSTIITTWVQHGLKMKKIGKYRVVELDELLRFMKNNPERYNTTQCEDSIFRGLEWFEKKRLLDREKMWKEREKEYINAASKQK